MSKRAGIISIVISVTALILAVISLAGRPQAVNEAPATDTQYVLYLGTNDKDTNEPVFAPDEAKEHAQKILIEHFGGYTIQEASGGWVDADTLYKEYTLVIYLSDTNADEVHKACDDLIKEFNQSSVLIQTNQTTTEFYGGN